MVWNEKWNGMERNGNFGMEYERCQEEASHANAHARAIACFSYIWFKYDILSLHFCKLGSVVVIMLSYQPSAPGFDSQLGSECVMQCAGTGKDVHEVIFFLLQNLALQLGLGLGCQAEGIAIT